MIALLLFVSTGCFSPETFVEAKINATCTWYQRCAILVSLGFETDGEPDLAECIDDMTANAEQSGEMGETCEPYDRGAAKDCVDELNDAGCEDNFSYPAACSEACPAN
jgi:hypothetical protein